MRKKSRRKATAPRRRTLSEGLSRSSKSMPRRRRRKTLSAGMGDFSWIMESAAGAIGIGIASNFIPDSINPKIKGLIGVGLGYAVAAKMKKPFIGAGIVGVSAYNLLKSFNLPLLSEMPTNFLAETPGQELYFDEYGNPLRRINDQLFYLNGQPAPYAMNQMVSATF